MEKLNNISNFIEKSQAERRKTLHSLGNIYLNIAGKKQSEIDNILQRVNRFDFSFWEAEYLDPDGKEWGMGTMDAFRCLIDEVRTTPLICGIFETVRELKRNNNKIVAIDAGTGTCILSMSLAAAGVDKVYALEINPATAKIAPDFIKEFGFENNIEVIECDATRINLGNLKADILVSENLSSALFDEPQYQIINNLSQYTAEDLKIIPHLAKTYAYLGSSEWSVVNKDKNNYTIAARRLSDLQNLTSPQPYFEVKSERGMNIPQIHGDLVIDVPSVGLPINVLAVCADFQINDANSPYVLRHDTAEFLGKSGALRIPTPVIPKDKKVSVHLNYPAGFPRRNTKIEVHENEIFLMPK
jgi:16S rRNA G966 N2-methylase RsmD